MIFPFSTAQNTPMARPTGSADADREEKDGAMALSVWLHARRVASIMHSVYTTDHHRSVHRSVPAPVSVPVPAPVPRPGRTEWCSGTTGTGPGPGPGTGRTGAPVQYRLPGPAPIPIILTGLPYSYDRHPSLSLTPSTRAYPLGRGCSRPRAAESCLRADPRAPTVRRGLPAGPLRA